MDNFTRVEPHKLLDFATAVYVSAGMPDAEARLAADTLVQADLWGHQSHGVMRLAWYFARLKLASVSRSPNPSWWWMPAR
jgi:LDH2 family malate/lactate/ureidoglycolate dehydrogenase